MSDEKPDFIVTSQDVLEKYQSLLEPSNHQMSQVAELSALSKQQQKKAAHLKKMYLQKYGHTQMPEPGDSFDIPLNYVKNSMTPTEAILAKIQAEIKEAQSWPHFAEIEHLIISVLKSDHTMSLQKAYKCAIEYYFSGKKFPQKTLTLPSAGGWSATLPAWKPMPKPGTIGDIQASEQAAWKAGQWNSVSYAKVAKPLDKDTIVKMFGEKMPQPPKPAMWQQNGALAVVRGLQKEVRAYNYHLCMGGGVLNTGKSEKDLDLYFLPMNQADQSDPAGLIQCLAIEWGRPEIIGKSAEYPATELPYIAKLKFTRKDKKRIDVFIMGATVFDVKACLDKLNLELVSIELVGTQIIHPPKKNWDLV